MSVILETQPGDEIIVLQEFNASPEGEPFSWKTSKKFRVGQKVKYVSFYRDEHFAKHPGLGWMIVFQANGHRYAATQTQFVNEDCWQDLKDHIAKGVVQDLKKSLATLTNKKKSIDSINKKKIIRIKEA